MNLDGKTIKDPKCSFEILIKLFQNRDGELL